MSDIKNLRQRCFFDLSVDTKNVGRVVFELFNDICPKTCDNFRSLCTGEKGCGKTTGKQLHYKNVPFHRVVKNFIIQSGDFSMGNGRGGESIFGGTFNDENFDLKHDKPFLLSMANRGPNTNGSQFFITLAPAPHLDGVHVVFGHVLSGHEIIAGIQDQMVDKDCTPLVDIIISNCGELIPQIKHKEKKKKHTKDKSKKSEGELTSDDEDIEGKKKKKDKKHKKHKKEKIESELKDEEKKESKQIDDLDMECSVRPEEVPVIPENNFLMRKTNEELEQNPSAPENSFQNYRREKSSRSQTTSSGRKIKGRGHVRYRTPSPRRNRRGSETPPHWRLEEDKLRSLKEVMNQKQRSENRESRDWDRSRFDSRRSYRPVYRRDNDFGDRDFHRNDRFQRENSNNGESETRQYSNRKRVFTEEPPSHKYQKRNSSPHSRQGFDNELRNIESTDREENESKALNTSYDEQSKGSDYREVPEKYSLKSEVKAVFKDDSRYKNRNEKRRNESPVDLTDIPLPRTDDSKRNSAERQHRRRRDRSHEKDLRIKERSKRDDRVRSRSKDEQNKSSPRRPRHRSDGSDSGLSVSSNRSQSRKTIKNR